MSKFNAHNATVLSAAKSLLFKAGNLGQFTGGLELATPEYTPPAVAEKPIRQPLPKPNTFKGGPGMAENRTPNPETDGGDHVNVSLDGRTELGRRLHSLYREEFTHPLLGPFVSVDALWQFLAHTPHLDELRYGYGPTLPREVRRLRDVEKVITKDFIPEFAELMFQAQLYRIKNNDSLYKLFIENELPFRTYYLYGDLQIAIPTPDRERAVRDTMRRIKDELWGATSTLPDMTDVVRRIMKDQIEIAKNDGVDHININPEGDTDLGRQLSHYHEQYFVDPSFGKFSCVEALWIWLTSKEKPDFLRNQDPSKVARIANRMKAEGTLTQIRIPEHVEIMFQVNYHRVRNNPDLYHMMMNCDLPFKCYHKFGPLEIAVNPINSPNMVSMFERVRRAVRDPNYELVDLKQIKLDIMAMSYS